MLDHVLVFLRDHLNEHLRPTQGLPGTDTAAQAVTFIDGEQMDPLVFQLGAVTALLINVEEENVLRSPDRFVGTASNGSVTRVNPEIRMNLYVLFVARYKAYETSLAQLSAIVRHFQSHRVFTPQSAPALQQDVRKLVMELVTLPLAEQNELWSSLRTTYHPSILYKVGLVAFRDEDGDEGTDITDMRLRTSQ